MSSEDFAEAKRNPSEETPNPPEVTPNPPKETPNPHEGLPNTPDQESEQEILRERPFLPRRPAPPRDTIVPRGISGMQRFPAGGRRRIENPDSADSPDHSQAADAETPTEARAWGRDRKPFSGERRPYGERKPYDRERKPYGERRPNDGERKPYGERRPYDGERKPYGERRPYDGERKPYGERRPYDGERKPYGERRPYGGTRPPYRQRRQDEPLSMAEELAEERSRGEISPETAFLNEQEQNNPTVAKLQQLTMAELIEEARKFEIPETELDEKNAWRQGIIFRIIREKVRRTGLMYGEGTLEILPDGFGFLRSVATHYVSCLDDIYVSPSQIRRFGLQTGHVVSGHIRPPKESERYFALLRVEAINYRDAGELSHRRRFEDLTLRTPSRQLTLETDPKAMEMRILDMMVPLGFGQRGLIIGPPKSGKTTLLRQIARAAAQNNPDLYVILLLVDTRPEELAAIREELHGRNSEVVGSTFDEPTRRHLLVPQMVTEKSKRMAESGRDVLILMDSLTHYVRACGTEIPANGKTLPSGLDLNAVRIPKHFFSAARDTENGGSVTLLATASHEPGNTLDEQVLTEFRGMSNLEMVLDARLVDQGIWPALDLSQSGSRYEEDLRTETDHARISKLRRLLGELSPLNAMEMLTNRLQKVSSNADFLESLN